ncbi:DUF1653 domain-containing protein [Microbulbifer sp. CAU 1566]|uniref:DUF1653 domain-containing protein n=1 Tax=unclassified Microbulbifer TaxID=2619833 RepID=UPI00135A2986|nr:MULTISPECIES: DUF1653 domain-containing protein [unclassified Microbulbifer]MCK7595745.1 DUF1653 domain-containing protein [Microbulbifer sp. CAU 1566]
MDPISKGIYRHYKNGKQYHLMEIATHSETGEQLAIYRALYDEFGVWARPLAMFAETVEKDGQQVPRFALEKRL